ncbi:MAG TPA: energy-coupling factor transporter transmembrane component T [Solirubrobacteraceae bacterium]|jgi:energy-coupling factor transport system permease protein|nr:energy-coupling factor transporter transmembrane component T [Solirubrobacteraceae bacterium]
MIYRRRASPLHAARAGAGCAYCLALGIAALMASNPIVLGAVAVAVVAAGAAAGVGRPLLRAALWGVPVALVIMLINALVTRDGLTVIVRLGDLPLLGHTDVTLEATAYGAILGLRAVALILCGLLYTLAVDPDEVLRLFRRVSFRSALSATLATRMVPILIRDGRRLAEAQRCRPGSPPSRLALMRAACTGVLDRALDVAAALEVRGYGAARRPPAYRAAYSRHDVAFVAAALVVVAVSILARVSQAAAFSAYPVLRVAAGPGALLLAGGVMVAALAPFANRRGLAR